MILVGEEDTWTPPAQCEKAVRALEGTAGPKAVIRIYPGVHHAFDFAGPPMVSNGHRLEYNRRAAADAIVRVRDFLARRLR